MKALQTGEYYKGYIAGYRDGVKAARDGVCTEFLNDGVTWLPVLAMELSTRAYNCLIHAGCVYVLDVVMLSPKQIATMRNLGKVSAAEIAHWLDAHGICYSVWSQYL